MGDRYGEFSIIGYVRQQVARSGLPSDLSFEVNVIPRAPEISKEDGKGGVLPANGLTSYCVHAGSLERNDAISWVPFARDVAGAPVRRIYVRWQADGPPRQRGAVSEHLPRARGAGWAQLPLQAAMRRPS